MIGLNMAFSHDEKLHLNRAAALTTALLLTVSFMPLLTQDARAAGFAVREQSAEFQGMSFAGAAAGGHGISAMFFNPATVTLSEGLTRETGVSLIMPHSKANDAGKFDGTAITSSGNIGETALVPMSYTSYKLNEWLFLGLSVNSPFGLVTEADRDYRGTPHGIKSRILNIVATPIVGMKFNDVVSVGFGPQFDYIDATLTSTTGANGTGSDFKVEGDDTGLGLVAGMLVNLGEKTRLGLGYRSTIEHRLEGKATLGPQVVGATADVDLPATATVSLRHQLNDDLTLAGSVEWADWSSLKYLTFNYAAPGLQVAPGVYRASSSEDYLWDDSWFFALGGEYEFSDHLTLRTGVAYEKSSVPDATRRTRIPDNDRFWLSVGGSYRAADWVTLHAAYTHIFAEDGDVQLDEGDPNRELAATFEQHVDIIAASATLDGQKIFEMLFDR